MATNKTCCFTCNKEKLTYNCKGCDKEFCLQHLEEHRQELNGQLDGIVNDHDRLRQDLIEHKPNPSNSTLIEQIDQWERTAIEKVKQKAQECRDTIIGHSGKAIGDIEQRLVRFTAHLKEIRQQENEFNEIDLQRLTDELTTMKRELTEPKNTSLEEDSRVLINDIRVKVDTANESREINTRKWKQDATVVAERDRLEHELDQVFYPSGIFVSRDKSLLIVDHSEHRVIRWRSQANTGTVIAGGKGKGKGKGVDQLNYPTDVLVDKRDHSIIIADQGNRRVIKRFERTATRPQILIDNIDCFGLAMDKEGFLYVSDREKSEVRRWKEEETEGIVVAGGNGEGDRLNQLNYPRFLFVDDEQTVYVSDWRNNRVMKWRRGATKGVIVAGGNGQGDRLNQLHHPEGLFVDRWGHIYVADRENHRVMRCREDESEGEIVVGGNGRGHELNQLFCPTGLSFDDEGSLYVAQYDSWRVMKFDLVVT